MDDMRIIGTFTIIDDVLTLGGHRDHCLAQARDSEVLFVAVYAAAYFQNHHERALSVLKGLHYLSGPLSISRFNRRLHRLAYWLPLLAEVLGRLFENEPCLIIDSLPVPVCRRVRARRCGKVRGAEYCGWCAAKKEKFFGWRVHLVCTPAGIPVRYSLLPAAYHDLTPIHELLWEVPAGVWVLGDKAYNSKADEASLEAETGVRLVPIRKANMTPNSWEERQRLEEYRHGIETLNSQAEKMGLERLYARSNEGFAIKVTASVVALVFSNIHKINDPETGLPLAWAA
jgi:Transposase DDE domain